MVFFKSLICCVLIAGIASALPSFPRLQSRVLRKAPNSPPQANSGRHGEIAIAGYSNEIEPATGSFQYGYQQNDGTIVSAKGSLNPNGQQVIEGSYSYVDALGVPSNIQYFSDENGYQAVGDAVPKSDPIIVKAVAYLRSLPPSPENNQQ